MSKTFVYKGITFALADSWAIRQRTRFLREVKSDESAIKDSIKATTHHIILNSVLSLDKSELGFFNLGSVGKKKVYSAGAAVALAIQKIVDEGEKADLTGEFLTLFEIGKNKFYGVAGSDGFVWADSERLLESDEEVKSWIDEHIPLMGNYAIIVIPEKFSSIEPLVKLSFDDIFENGKIPDVALIKKNQLDYRKFGLVVFSLAALFFAFDYGNKYYKEYQKKKMLASLSVPQKDLPRVPPVEPWDGQRLGTWDGMRFLCMNATKDFPLFANGWERSGLLCEKSGEIVAVYHRPDLVPYSAIYEIFGKRIVADEKNPDVVSIGSRQDVLFPLMDFKKDDLLDFDVLRLMWQDTQIILESAGMKVSYSKMALNNDERQILRGEQVVYEDPALAWWDGISFEVSGASLINIEFPKGCTIDSINYETISGENFSINGVCYAKKN